MSAGDTVIYTIEHHEWLVQVGKWPSKYVPRTAHRGTVRFAGPKVVLVEWPNGVMLRHFADNVEVLVTP